LGPKAKFRKKWHFLPEFDRVREIFCRKSGIFCRILPGGAFAKWFLAEFPDSVKNRPSPFFCVFLKNVRGVFSAWEMDTAGV
jgi:hypothetical protein